MSLHSAVHQALTRGRPVTGRETPRAVWAELVANVGEHDAAVILDIDDGAHIDEVDANLLQAALRAVRAQPLKTTDIELIGVDHHGRNVAIDHTSLGLKPDTGESMVDAYIDGGIDAAVDALIDGITETSWYRPRFAATARAERRQRRG